MTGLRGSRWWAVVGATASLLVPACSNTDENTSPTRASMPASTSTSTSTSTPTSASPSSSPATEPEPASSVEPPPTLSPKHGGPGAPPNAPFRLADAIRERVFVTNGRDDDGDGQSDQMSLDVIRPDTAEPVPVIMVQSPYWDNAGRGREGEKRRRGAGGVVASMPLFYDNWFVPQGYAFVALDSPGYSSDGCDDNFGPASTASSMAALDWLSGAGPAVDDAGAEVTASWSNGIVGMIGKSADGSLAVSAAATGHPALKAIVPIEGVTSLLERGTAGGLLAGPVPAPEWFESEPECRAFAEQFIAAWGDGFTYTDFWRDRDPTVDMTSYTAATFIVNGFADWNVGTSQVKLLWDALRDRGLARRMWLHQYGHDDPFDVRRQEWVDELSRFFDHHLRGAANGIDTDPAVTIQNIDGSWSELADWPPPPPPQRTSVTWVWRDGALAPSDPAGPAATVVPIGVVQRDVADEAAPSFEGFMEFWLADPVAERAYRSTLVSAPLSEPLTILGEPTVTASFQMTGARYGIVATLIDLGPADRIDPEAATFGADLVDSATESCWGENIPADDACYIDAQPDLGPTQYGIIATGGSGIERATFRNTITPVPDGQWVTTTIGLGMANTVIPAGHRLAVVFTASSLVFAETVSARTVTIGSDLRISLGAPA